MIRYPNKIEKNKKEKIYGNRGMTLEAELNESNRYYLEKGIAVIYKKPTPVKVIKQVNYKIVDGYFEKPSTTDYNGLYKGKYIDYEAKETKNKTSFPLSNICFLIVRFTVLNETYLLFGKDFIEFIETNDKKSIPISYFKEKAYLIKDKLAPRIDYIEVLDKYGGIYETKEKN